jgi:hypothetical protein
VFALKGAVTDELISYQGRVIVHHDRRELEYLFPGVRVEMLRGYTIAECAQEYGRPMMRLADHPDMQAVSWPLNPKEFIT